MTNLPKSFVVLMFAFGMICLLFGMLVVKFISTKDRQRAISVNHETGLINYNKMITVDALGIPSLVLKKQGQATAYAPDAWSMVASDLGTVDLYSPGRNEYAGSGVFAVNRQMQSYYGSLYGAPEESVLTIINGVLKQLGTTGNAQYTTEIKSFGSFLTVRDFESSEKQGRIFYSVYGNPNTSYTETVYIACTDKDLWESHKSMLVNMALSIRAHAGLKMPAENNNVNNNDENKSNKDQTDADPLKNYNAQLGTQWFHDDLGNNYNVDPNQASVNGPQGEGVYKVNGNDVTKLLPGFSNE